MNPDNKKLEKLIKEMDMGYVGPSDAKREFLELFKESQLFMPVIMSEDFFENIEDSKPGDVFTTTERSGFDINFISYGDDMKGVPLFTSSELMESTGLRSSAIGIFMSDLAGMLEQTDRYSMVFINPYTDLSVDLPIESFLNLFRQNREMQDALAGVLKVLKERSVEIEEDYLFYLRAEDNFMRENAVDGIFVPQVPFNVSSSKDFHSDLKYLNIIGMPKSSKILFLGGVVDEDHYDTILAPGCEFKLIEEVNEFVTVWQCVAQPFYDD